MAFVLHKTLNMHAGFCGALGRLAHCVLLSGLGLASGEHRSGSTHAMQLRESWRRTALHCMSRCSHKSQSTAALASAARLPCPVPGGDPGGLRAQDVGEEGR